MKTTLLIAGACALLGAATTALGQQAIDPANSFAWNENCGWLNFHGGGSAVVIVRSTYLAGDVWGENIGWVHLGDVPADGYQHANIDDTNYGVNIDPITGELSGFAWNENYGWINFAGGALASPSNPARLDRTSGRFRGFAWGENIGWINLDDSLDYVGVVPACGSADFNCDGDVGTDADIDAFFACLSGNCPPPPCSSTADFNADGDVGTDSDIEAFFRVLAGGPC
jgi:hypothetical protein